MADQNPSLHIDTDWKKQAQEEKRRLAEQEKEKTAAAPVSPGAAKVGAALGAAASSPAAGADPRSVRAPGKGARELPPANFGTLVQSLVTQALFYLGDLSPRGQEPMLNLDMAKHQIDMLGVLEEKAKNNLSADEQKLLDAALYETRMRYVNVASQYIS